MGNVRLYGSTSGYTELAPPAVAPDGVLSLPSGVGTLLTAEGGKVLQVVRATNATDQTTTSNSYTDVTGMSITITPQKNTSNIIILSAFHVNASNTNTLSRVSLYQLTDSANTALSGAQGYDIGLLNGTPYSMYTPVTLVGYASPATTSAVTYKLRFKVNATPASTTIFNSIVTGQLYAIEVSA